MSNPIVVRFSSLADISLRNRSVSSLYCHREYLGRKIKVVKEFDLCEVDLADVVGKTEYPETWSRLCSVPHELYMTRILLAN